jgi:secernin
MGCDIVVALGQATVNGQSLFGLNRHGPRAPWPLVRRLAGQVHAPGSVVKTGAGELPQLRQTFTVLGCGACGEWGLTHGVNEHQVAMGVASWTSKCAAPQPGLPGTDLVRLTLERGRSARQAMEVLTDFISRHGQGQAEGSAARDNIFLIADPHEALVIEAAGRYWAALECQQVRAVTDRAMIRQDWQRLAPGLATHAVAQGWWHDDGSKVDFSGCLGAHNSAHGQALKRWGRATVLLEQQNGHIDLWFLRRMLAEHFEGAVRRQIPGEKTGTLPTLAATFLTALTPAAEAVALAWCAFGAPSQSVYFPVFLDGELPAFFDEENVVGDGFLRLPAFLDRAMGNREELDKVQAQLDQQAEDFIAQARLLKKEGNLSLLHRQATLFMAQIFGGADVARDAARGRRPAQAENLAFFAE